MSNKAETKKLKRKKKRKNSSSLEGTSLQRENETRE